MLIGKTAPRHLIENICSGNGKFVAITNRIYTNKDHLSEDRINWTLPTWSCSDNIKHVCKGNGKIVVAKLNTGKVAVSEDRINWTEAIMPENLRWLYAYYENGKFMALLQKPDIPPIVAWSEDGINWNALILPEKGDWDFVCFLNGKFIATGTDEIAESEDGINWEIQKNVENEMVIINDRPFRLVNNICSGNGKLVFIFDSFKSNTSLWSTDGNNWTRTTLPSIENWRSVCFGDRKFVAIAYNSDTAAWSTDGNTWTKTTLPEKNDWRSVCYGNWTFVATANKSDIAAVSEDGINWTLTPMPAKDDWVSVCFIDGKFVDMGIDEIAESIDRINWEIQKKEEKNV